MCIMCKVSLKSVILFDDNNRNKYSKIFNLEKTRANKSIKYVLQLQFITSHCETNNIWNICILKAVSPQSLMTSACKRHKEKLEQHNDTGEI